MSDNRPILRRRPAVSAPVATSTVDSHFATVPLGSEELTAHELIAAGATDCAITRGGVSFHADRSVLYRCLLTVRTASRLLVNRGSFEASSPENLYDGIRQMDWTALIDSTMTIAVDATVRDSALTHSHFVALKVKDAIVDQIRDARGSRPSVNTKDPDLRINIHLSKNICSVSLDASGTPLDRRGWRLDRNQAPLRETLAAAIIKHTGWDGSVPLLDPMCGSGTLLVEAAAMALNKAAGMGRSFGIERWRDFDRTSWNAVKKELQAAERDSLSVPIFGFDQDPKSIIAARENARRAGLSYAISFDTRPFELVEPVGHQGVIVMNPPYGIRMGDWDQLTTLYRSMGDLFKQRFAGWTAYVLAGDLELAKMIGLKPSRRFVLFNGPLECRLLKFDLY